MPEFVFVSQKRQKAPSIPAWLSHRMESILQEQYIANDLTQPQLQHYIHQVTGILLTPDQIATQIRKHNKQKSNVQRLPASRDPVSNPSATKGNDPSNSSLESNGPKQYGYYEHSESSMANEEQRSSGMDLNMTSTIDHIDEPIFLIPSKTPALSVHVHSFLGTRANNTGLKLHYELSSGLLSGERSRNFSTSKPVVSQSAFSYSHSHVQSLHRYAAVAACSGFLEAVSPTLDHLLDYLLKHVNRSNNGLAHEEIVLELFKFLMLVLRVGLNRHREVRYIRKCWNESLRVILYTSVNAPRLSGQGLLLRQLALAAFVRGHMDLYQGMSDTLLLWKFPEAFTPTEVVRLNSLQSQRYPLLDTYGGDFRMHEIFPSKFGISAMPLISSDFACQIGRTVLQEMLEKISTRSTIKISDDHAVLWQRAPSYAHLAFLDRWVSLAYLCTQQWQCKMRLHNEQLDLGSLPFRIYQELESGQAPILTIWMLLTLSQTVWDFQEGATIYSWHERGAAMISGLLRKADFALRRFSIALNSQNLDEAQTHFLTDDYSNATHEACCADPLSVEKFFRGSLRLIQEILAVKEPYEVPLHPPNDNQIMRDATELSLFDFNPLKRQRKQAFDQSSIRSIGSSYLRRYSLASSSTDSLLSWLKRTSRAFSRTSLTSSRHEELATIIDEYYMDVDTQEPKDEVKSENHSVVYAQASHA